MLNPAAADAATSLYEQVIGLLSIDPCIQFAQVLLDVHDGAITLGIFLVKGTCRMIGW